MTEVVPFTGTNHNTLSPTEHNVLKEQARTIAKSGLAPRGVDSPEKVLVIAMKGRELGIPAMQALSHIHIVEGKPTVSSELMVALVQRAGHRLRVLETTAERCVVQGVRRDDPEYPQELTFSMEDAQAAGVAGKQNWKRYPAAMLRARAISALCRFAFADVLMGASYTPEELGAVVDDEGQVLEGEVLEEPATRSEEHEALLKQIGEAWRAIPEGQRPGKRGVWDYAVQSEENAAKSLERLRTLATSAETSTDPAEESDKQDETDEDWTDLLKAIADELYGDRAEHLSGSEWKQRDIGRPFSDLTPEEAEALHDEMLIEREDRDRA